MIVIKNHDSTSMIDALAHSLLCHLSLYLLTSKSFDLLMTLQQCKLSVCLHGFFVPFHIVIIHPTEKKIKPCSCLAFACICYAVDLVILRFGCVHFAPLVYVTDALFCLVGSSQSNLNSFVSWSHLDSPSLTFVCPRANVPFSFCTTPQHYLSWPYLSPLCLSTFVCVGSFSRQARVEIALAVCSLSDLFVKRTAFISKTGQRTHWEVLIEESSDNNQ